MMENKKSKDTAVNEQDLGQVTGGAIFLNDNPVGKPQPIELPEGTPITSSNHPSPKIPDEKDLQII